MGFINNGLKLVTTMSVKIITYFVIMLAYIVGLMPFPIIYFISDINYFIIYYIARYRRKVVRDNLVSSFPEKDIKEIKKIERKFYHNLCDIIVECSKLLYIKSRKLAKRIKINNPELLQELYEQNRSIFLAIPHSGNWEWFGKILHFISNHDASAIYKKMTNTVADKFIYKLRMNYHIGYENMIEANSVLRTLIKRKNLCNSILIVADQSPRGTENDYWTMFLNKKTAFFTGLEKMSKLLNYCVIFVAMKRVKRGYYEVTFKTICINPKEMGKNFITESYVRGMEDFIKENPSNWLWSHRRWKHKYPEKNEKSCCSNSKL